VILSDNPSFSLDLEEQLTTSHHEIEVACHREIDLESRHEILQWTAHGTVAAINARGVSPEDRLQDILIHATEVATHGVRYGAGAALAVVQLRSGHELCHLELGFPDTDRLEDQEDLFTNATEAIAVIIHAEDVVNNVFSGA
jgi:hypothetical protein